MRPKYAHTEGVTNDDQGITYKMTNNNIPQGNIKFHSGGLVAQ